MTRWILRFSGDNFVSGQVVISAGDAASLVPKYFEVKKFLVSRYGRPSEVKENADPNELAANGKAMRSSWSAVGGSGVTIECIAGHLQVVQNWRVAIDYSNERVVDVPKTTAAKSTEPSALAPQAPVHAVSSCSFATVKLNDGRTLQGDILSEDSEQLVIQTESQTGVNLLKCTLRKSEVTAIERWKRQQRLQSLRSMSKQLEEQIAICRENARTAMAAQKDADRKWEKYRKSMSKTHGNSGTLTQLEMDVNTAKAKAATAQKQKQQLEALRQAIEQKIAQVHD